MLSDDVLDVIATRAAELVLQRLADVRAPTIPCLMTVAEAAEYLRCKPQRIYDLRSSGRLSGTKDGARVLIARDDLEAYVARGRR